MLRSEQRGKDAVWLLQCPEVESQLADESIDDRQVLADELAHRAAEVVDRAGGLGAGERATVAAAVEL